MSNLAGATTTFTGTSVISGAGNVLWNGPGTGVFNAAHTYTGVTVVNTGTLRLGSSLDNTAISVAARAIISSTVTTSAGTSSGTAGASLVLGDGATLDLSSANAATINWYPLYGYVRRLDHSAHDAQDLAQDFFARLCEKGYLQAADRFKGRFRTFLLMALKRFAANEWDRTHAQKRGGGKIFVPFMLSDDGTLRQLPLQPAPQTISTLATLARDIQSASTPFP